jgi:DNA-binding SARP family transcriptional activator
MHRHRGRTAGPIVPHTGRVHIRLLGGFEVVVDGTATPTWGWRRRPAAALVKVLALAPSNRLHREQVLDLLWPDDPPAEAAPKLHKAAHYARRAAGSEDAIVLRNDVAQLFPRADLTVDVARFDELSRRAIADADPDMARAATDAYPGELLPDDRYEEWAAERRELLRLRHLKLLRLAGRWMDVTELDPGDEHAHVELMRDHLASGDCEAAVLQYERLERVLDRDLGVAPGRAARELRDRVETMCVHGIGDLVAELAELTRRQAVLLETLAAAAPGTGRLAVTARVS